MSTELEKYLEDVGYSDLRVMPAGQLCGLKKFIFTSGLMVGLNPISYERRYCYEFESDARAALALWDGMGHPTGPWIKCKGRNIEFLNPEIRS